eukprot:gene14914-16456_t
MIGSSPDFPPPQCQELGTIAETPQQHWQKTSDQQRQTAMDALVKELRKIVFDERFFFCHNYQEGDQVFVNNYTTLHGRVAFSSQRELWRLQAIPPSDNLPSYFKKQC